MFKLSALARYILLTLLFIVALATAAEVVLGFNRGYWGVVISDALKLAVYALLIWYLNSASVKREFSGAGKA